MGKDPTPSIRDVDARLISQSWGRANGAACATLWLLEGSRAPHSLMPAWKSGQIKLTGTAPRLVGDQVVLVATSSDIHLRRYAT
jgi:hypothetical protein